MDKSYTVGNLIYDANIYDGMNTSLDDLEFYKRWLPKNKDARILELCCGTGRLTIPIAKDGFHITGVDYTTSMIEKAKVKASKENLAIKFIEADIRTLDLPEKYDFIFIPFNSIHHLYKNKDLFKTLSVVKKHLKEGGLFLLDCFNPNIKFIIDGGKELKEVTKYMTPDGREILLKEIMKYEHKSQINRIEWHYSIDGKFDSIQKLDMRMFFPQELDTYLKWNGFTIRNKFGNFSEKEFNDNSEKQIFICETK
jgi:SAM-dependent methyltransferase